MGTDWCWPSLGPFKSCLEATVQGCRLNLTAVRSDSPLPLQRYIQFIIGKNPQRAHNMYPGCCYPVCSPWFQQNLRGNEKLGSWKGAANILCQTVPRVEGMHLAVNKNVKGNALMLELHCFSWGDMDTSPLTPGREPMTHWRHNSAKVQPGEPMSFLGLLRVARATQG